MNSNPSYLSMLTSSIQSFPVLPSIVVRIMELTANPESSVEDLLEVIRIDPSLTTMVLKLSNSAYFGQIRKVSSLKQAISVLGINEIRDIVVARAMFHSFKHMDKKGVFDIRDFWLHSFMCGLSAKIISRDIALLEDFFIYGLIHDVGKLVFLTALPVMFLDIIEKHKALPFDIYKEEEENFGITHAEIGMVLLKRWMFPEHLVSTVGFHHQPERSEKNDVFPYLIFFADMVSHLDAFAGGEIPGSLFEDTVIQDRAKVVGIDWSREAVNGYLETLNSMKEEAQDAFSLIYS